MNIDVKQPATFAIWCFAVTLWAILARIGWELGGRIWAFL
jgi:hypothetical protein